MRIEELNWVGCMKKLKVIINYLIGKSLIGEKKMTENEFLLQDRIAKIKSINEQYNLLENSYISFSGGKDSTVLSYLIDEALPENKIPRVFINTGIEYDLIFKFVKEKQLTDERIYITFIKTLERFWNNTVILLRVKNIHKNYMYIKNFKMRIESREYG